MIKPWKEMSAEEQRDILLVYIKGHSSVQFKTDRYSSWLDCCSFLSFGDDLFYRVKPKKTFVNWEIFDPRWRYLVKDKSGSIVLFESKPKLLSEVIYASKEHDGWSYGEQYVTLRPSIFSSHHLRLGNCHWRNSLVIRPN